MYILASSSPRRKELMKNISSTFLVMTSNFDETSVVGMKVKDLVMAIAKGKGQEVHEKYYDDIVISADTIVTLDNEVIGKPKDKEDAYRILVKLSGRTHFVYTGYTIFYKEKVVTNVVESKVIFNELSDELILSYIESGSPLDKAGAYGIQDNKEFPLINRIEGSYDNIVGFPVKEILIDLKKHCKT